MDTYNQLFGTFFVVGMALSSVGLLVGGVGVVAIMMISVTNAREIGVRKAPGATRATILWQFLVEAVTLTGSALGLVLGHRDVDRGANGISVDPCIDTARRSCRRWRERDHGGVVRYASWRLAPPDWTHSSRCGTNRARRQDSIYSCPWNYRPARHCCTSR